MAFRWPKKRHKLGIILTLIFLYWAMLGAIVSHPQWGRSVYSMRQDYDAHQYLIDIPAPKDYTGKWIQWYPTGWKGDIKREINYKNGILDGELKLYRRDGTKLAEKIYVNGKLDGKITFYHTNGRMRWTGCIAHDALDGRFRSWDKSGRPTTDGIYQINKEYTGIFYPQKYKSLPLCYIDFPDNDEICRLMENREHKNDYEIEGISNIFDESAVVYYLKGKEVSKETYLVAAKQDSTLPDLDGTLAATAK